MKKYITLKIYFRLIILSISVLSAVNTIAQSKIGFSYSNMTIYEKDTFAVVINADSLLTGKEIYSFKFGFNYNQSYLKYLGIDSVGTALKNWSLPIVNSSTNGQILVAAAGSEALTGNGALIYLRFVSMAPGYTYINNIPSYNMLNEGNPLLTFKDAYINALSIPIPDLYPDSKELYVGETHQMQLSGGKTPYTFESLDVNVATINSTGLVTAIGPGSTKLVAIDALGRKGTTTGTFDVKAIKLSIQSISASIQDTLYLPIKMEVAPGTKVYSGSFELAYNTNLEPIQPKNKKGDFAISLESKANSSLTRVSFASANGISGSGILCYIAFKGVGNGTHYPILQNSNFNENLKCILTNGTVQIITLPQPDIYPDSKELFVGETIQMNVSSGTSPFLFASTNTNVATVNSTGKVTATGPGLAKIYVTDSNEKQSYTSGSIDVRAIKLSLLPAGASVQDTFYLPVRIEVDPGTKLYSGSFELSFNSNLQGVKSDFQIGEFPATMQTNTATNLLKVSFASSVGFTGTGILCYVGIKGIVNGTHYITPQNAIFNEGLKAFVSNGTVGIECKPCLKVSNMTPENAAENMNTTIDLYWQNGLNARYYNLYLWESGNTKPTNPYYSGIYGTSARVYNLKTGTSYTWKIVSVNDCSTSESTEQTFSTKPVPDLTVTDIQLPKEIESGSNFDINFTIKNIGQTATSSQWADAVYIATDTLMATNKTQLMSKYNPVQLAVNESYTQSYRIMMPNEYKGNYYVFVATDHQQSLTELNENNNQKRFGDTIKVKLRPFPDITVKEITATETKIVPGDSIQINWKVENIGNADAVGGWSERISLVSSTGRKLALIPQPNYLAELKSKQTISRTGKFKIPDILGFSGNARIQVELIPTPSLIEYSNTAGNNNAFSATTIPISDFLYFDITTAALSEGSTSDVKCIVTRSGEYDNSLTVSLNASPTGQVNIPATVSIGAKQSSAIFYLKAIDNSVLDETRKVTIIASTASYRNDTASIDLLDNEALILKAKLNKTEATEGETLQLRIVRNLVSATELKVYLSTDKPNQFSFTNTATIPANDSVVVVPVAVTNDKTPELNDGASITISSLGFVSGTVSAVITDDDIPTLQFRFSNDTVQETAGIYATYGSIKRLSGEGNITIHLTASDPNALIFPATITLPNGTNEAKFNIGVVDNNEVDGYRKIDFTGSIYIASCSCTTTPDNGGIIQNSLVIADNDGPALSVKINPLSLFEGRVNAGILTISRNTETSKSLSVSIVNGDATEVILPVTAIIPAGQKSVEIPVSTINDGTEDGNQAVTITAQANGFISGFCFLFVTDLNKPDFVIQNHEITKNTALTSEVIQINGKLMNIGYLNAPMGSKIGFYLSNDDFIDASDQLLNSFVTTSQLLMGDSVLFSKELKLPSKTGDYKILAHANPNNEVNELVYTNNTANPIKLKIAAEYTATAIVDLTQFLPNNPVTIHGKATKLNSQAATNVNVDIYLLSNGTRKELKAVTDNNGEYTIEFTPMPNETGHFKVGACFPEEGLSDAQDEFNILGIKRTTNDNIIWVVKKGIPLNGTLQVLNTSNINLKNVQMRVDQLPAGCIINVNPIPLVKGNETATFNYTITGNEITKLSNYEKINFKLTTDEGVTISYNAFYFCQELEALLQTDPASINTTISKGSSKYYEFGITNNGAGETGKVVITVPKVNFMSLISSDTINNIKPGESVRVTIKLTDNDLPLNTPVNGSIAINCEHGNGMAMPYKLEAVSNAKGGLKIDVVDEYTYNTAEAPHLKNAHVVVRHPFSGQIVAEGFTGNDGIFSSDSIPEGYYSVTIEAEKHEGYRNNLIIDAGKTLEQTIFISFQAISYTWEVVPTEIEDEYQVDLIMKFETSVPAPVVIMEMPKSMPQLINDETYPFMVTLTNKGLITAVDVTLTLPNDPEYEFMTNFTKMDLLAQQSIQIPVVMKRKMAYNPIAGLQKTIASNLNCYDVIVEGHAFYCGPDKKWHQGAQLFKFEGRVCVGTGGTPGFNPGGGGDPTLYGYSGPSVYVVPTNNNSVVSVNDIVECDNCLMDIGLAILGCIPFTSAATGVGINTVGCLKSASDGEMSAWDWFTCVGGYITTPVKQVTIGCIIGVLNAAKTCFYDEPFWKSPPMKPLQVKTLNNANKPLMPPIIKQATSDLLSVLDAADARRNWINEFLGNPNLFDRINIADFLHEIDSFTVYNKKIEALDILSINQKLYGTDILAAEVEAFANRWNRTLDAHKQDVFEPTTEFPDIINDKLLKLYVSQEDSTIQYAKSRGFESISQMAEMGYNAIKEETNTGKKSVCASITLKISQKVVMTREAFEGTLTIENGNTQTAMTKIKLNLEVKNSQGILSNDLFQINTKALSILTGIDGTGELGAGKKGSASILFIPEKGAAPEVTASYSFGGSFSYIDPFNGLEVTKQLFPITLEVHPSPDLFLHYFMQRDILGDDPLTEKIEPIVPAELALMIQNNGFGQANKVRVESAQPEIIENQKGLAIHVALIGSNLNGQPRQLGLTNIDFGNIPAKSSTLGQWWFTSDLLGHFVNYETRVVHLNSYGNPDLSLISGAKLHELIHSVRVYTPDDGINDFLVNEVQDANETPDNIYTSNGAVLPVSVATAISTTGVIGSPLYQLELNVTPKIMGWNYGKINDPGNGNYKIQSITRKSDNKVLPLDNVWQTHVTLPDGFDPVYENKLHIVDDFSTLEPVSYILKFVPGAIDPPTVDKFENIPTSVSASRLSIVRVVFEKPINPDSFSFEDLVLRVQGGENIINGTVTITQINSTAFDINISSVTLADGYYVLTVKTDGITNPTGESGIESKQASWSQFTNTPAIQEYIGLPTGAGKVFDNLIIRFTIPIDTLTFSATVLKWLQSGNEVTGNIEITKLDAESKLFKISGLTSVFTEDGLYTFTVDLTKIKSKTGVFGMNEQSVSFKVDTKAPEINEVTLRNDNGYDSQHITNVELVFSEPVTSFGVSSVELWKGNQQQPISQLNISKKNDSTFIINDFRLLTYYEGSYTLKINLDNVSDYATNKGNGITQKVWVVNRNAPAAVTEMKISPDLGISANDGITSTNELTVSMKVNAPECRIKLYYNSLGSTLLLIDTLPAGSGTINLAVTIPVAGNMKLLAECIDKLGNKSTTEMPVYIDLTPLSATWDNIQFGILRKHPNSILLDFSDKLAGVNTIKNNLVCKYNGVITTINSLSITQTSDNQYEISGFGNVGELQGGLFSVSVNTAGLNKYLSGKSGQQSQSIQWNLRGNNPPVAITGPDQTADEGSFVLLNGSSSYDADNDALIYNWTAPAGIVLSDIHAARPTFIVTGTDPLTFSLTVNDGVSDSDVKYTTITVTKTDIKDIPEVEDNAFIYPNPAYNEFMLKFYKPVTEDFNILLYNNLGQLVYIKNNVRSTTNGEYKFSNLNLNSGHYYVKISSNKSKSATILKFINISN